MPDKIIDIPNVGSIAFPDSMSAADMNAAAAKLYKDANPSHPPADPQHSWVDTAVNWIPAVAGGIGGVVGGIGGTVAGVGVGGVPGAIGGAAVGGAAGEAAKQLINRARGAQAPATPLEAAKDIGVQGAVQGAAETVGQGLGAGMLKAAPWVMQSALKPGIKAIARSMRNGEAVPRVVQTLLDEGVNVSPGGVANLNDILTATNADIKAAVASAPGRISPLKATSALTDTARKFADQVNPEADLEAISEAGQQFLNHPRFTGPTISVPEAQTIKSGTYQQLAGKYGELSSASGEAQKALARGLKEQIAAEVPGISALNAREGNVIEALQAVSRRAAAAGNRDSVGFAWVTQHPATFLASLIDRSPAAKSLIARGLYRQAANVAGIAPQLIRGAIVALAQGDSSPTDAPTSGSADVSAPATGAK